MRSIRELKALAGVPVLVRAALNVPIEGDNVANDYRLRKALPTINYLAEHGAKVILISHMGQAGTETLAPVAKALSRFVPRLDFCPETIGEKTRAAIRALPAGTTLMLENLRRDPREVANDPTFAQELSLLGDIFVEDSFDTCHREHASIVTLPKLLPAYAGLLLEEEVAALGGALSPAHPALAVVGGAKFATKERVLTTLLASYDRVFIGGALANDFLRAAGHDIGTSYASGVPLEEIEPLLKNKKLILPVDVRVIPGNMAGAIDAPLRARVARLDDIKPDEMVLDLGPATSALLAELVSKSKAVLWNGPLGKYETGFIESTDALARAIGNTPVHSVVGGGDTVASIESLGLLTRFSFVSTGGGAMLDFLAEGSLPGIQVLETGGL